MRRLNRPTKIAVLVGVLVVLGALVLFSSDDDGPASGGPLLRRTVAAGDVTVTITPERVDDGGAEFEVVFDTHSVELDLDVARRARFTVGGIPWSGAVWTGDGPGGHHREGTLGFTAGGEPSGEAELVIDGIPGTVVATWHIPAG